MSDIEIITLPLADWQAYRALRLESLRTDPLAFGSRYEDMLQQPDSFWQDRLADAQAGEKSWLQFARAADQLVGMIGAFATDDSDVVRIISVYVRPENRGQGVGNLLMEAILETVKKTGRFKKAALGVNPVQRAAFGLYQRFGFEVVSEETVTRDDGEVRESYEMEKALG